jgi:glutamate N-acetyltransferase/amino-acid N-acetyltransferase
LKKALSDSVDISFNMISVDRDTSTNDQCTLLANGLAENPIILEENEDYATFKEALKFVTTTLAKKIAYDGEGATKFLTAHVQGAATVQDARIIAKSVITSNLVKTAFFGKDANWGRVLAAMGYSGVEFDPEKVSIKFVNDVAELDMMIDGTPVNFDEALALSILEQREITIEMFMKEGDAEATAWGCDLSFEYVNINGNYRT